MTEAKSETINIDRLYDYTKFHIGIYAGLVAGTLGLLKVVHEQIGAEQVLLLSIAATLFALAGGFGGIVCTNCLRFKTGVEVSRHQRASFWREDFAPLTLQSAANGEHLAFWLGILAALATLWL